MTTKKPYPKTKNRLTLCGSCNGLSRVIVKNPEKEFEFYEETQETRLAYFKALERWTVALKDDHTIRDLVELPDHMAIRCEDCNGTGYNGLLDIAALFPFWLINGFVPSNLDHFFGNYHLSPLAQPLKTFKAWFGVHYGRDAAGTLQFLKEKFVQKVLSDASEQKICGFLYETLPDQNHGEFSLKFMQSRLRVRFSRQSIFSLAAHMISETSDLTDSADTFNIEATREQLITAAKVLLQEAHVRRHECFTNTDELLKALDAFKWLPVPHYEAGATLDDLPVDLKSDPEPRVPVGGYGRILDEGDLRHEPHRRDGDEVH